jgi:hypothetical protein
MWARFTVLNETPSAAAIADCVMPLSRGHVDALALRRREFPAQRGFQFPDLTLGRLVHLTIRPPNQIITAHHSALLNRLQPATSIRRFNQLLKRYKTLAGYCRQLLVLASIRLPRGWRGAPHRVRLTLRSCKPTSSAYEQ